ncbi:tRNA threonylcarbamoyladenosine biosynthesis protein TsaE [hydrothermal vent metagenome]|uniref:tRNA threonylcarbamoyladenosine biosynthesis protein TsaE n=1 Tax=hydrothermal vent metagenome TaxID=652676 RepID=A0A3B0Y0R5_9ZZZZ
MANNKVLSKSFQIANEQQMQQLGASLCQVISAPCRLNLSGDLGAGKTTFTRGFIRATGYKGMVKSPTYTLVEPYALSNFHLYHIDLYRLSDPEELEFLGVREMLEEDSILIAEWPELGKGVLPDPDLALRIEYKGEERAVGMSSVSNKGREMLMRIEFEGQ